MNHWRDFGGDGPAVLVVVGQSLGGLTALSLAARHPSLVRGLVLVEASPDGGGAGVEEAVSALGEALRSWPVPFASRADAEAYFAERFGGRLAGEACASGLEARADGWWPRFDVEVMTRMLRAGIAEPSWEEWERASRARLCTSRPEGSTSGSTGVRAWRSWSSRAPATTSTSTGRTSGGGR